MKAAKIIAIFLGAYIGIVAAFESLIGILQPTSGTTLVIASRDDGGNAHERVLARLESGGQI